MVFDKIFIEKESERITVSYMNEPHMWTEIFSVDVDKKSQDDVIKGIEVTMIAMYGSEILSNIGEEIE